MSNIFKDVPREKITPELLKSLEAMGHISPEIIASMKKDLLEKLETECHKQLKGFITVNPDLCLMKSRIEKVCPHNDAVLFIGPTGTGKEILAKALHGDRTGAFQAVNCAGLPESLIESELFGHVKGSFTGAVTDKRGLMQAANAGTLFMDEIGELPLHVQGKLLRALQERKVRKVGATEDEKIDCRFVFATNRNLHDMSVADKFRLDLYHRISTVEFHIPGLRNRPEDIIPLLQHYDTEKRIKDYEEWKNILNPPPVNPFYSKDGPMPPPRDLLDGNVRSLQKYIRRFYLFGEML